MSVHNSFAKPRTAGQWLLKSICWTAFCIGVWLPMASLLADGHLHSLTADGFTIAGFWLGHVVIWRKALSGWNSFIRLPEAQLSVLGALGSIWLAFLLLFQVASLLLGMAWTLLTILFFCSNCID